MKEKELKNILKAYNVPKHDKDAPMKTMEFIHENLVNKQKVRTDDKQFILSQVGFIRKRTWLFQVIILGLLCLGFYHLNTESDLNFRSFSLMSILAPLLLIINVDEISRIYNKSMLEIEFSTKNSLKKVLVTRMTILGVADLTALIIMMIFTGKLIDLSVIRVILYTLVPFNIVCIGCMELMKYFKGKSLNYACASYSALLIATILLGRFNDLGIYAQDVIENWILVYVITTIIFTFEIKRIWKRLECFDDISKEAII